MKKPTDTQRRIYRNSLPTAELQHFHDNLSINEQDAATNEYCAKNGLPGYMKQYFDKIREAEADLWNLSDGERTGLLLDNFDLSVAEAHAIVKAARIEIPTIPEPKS